jgi:hypothetical protein
MPFFIVFWVIHLFHTKLVVSTTPGRRMGEWKVQLHVFLISILDRGERSSSRYGRFIPLPIV